MRNHYWQHNNNGFTFLEQARTSAKNGFGVQEMFETVICAVQQAVKKKEAERCTKWNRRKTERGPTNRSESMVVPIKEYFSLWSCLTDCGSMEESREGGNIGASIDTGSVSKGYSIPEVESPAAEFNRSFGSHWDLTSNETTSSFPQKSEYNSPSCLSSNGETDIKNVHCYKQNYSDNKYTMVGNNSQDP